MSGLPNNNDFLNEAKKPSDESNSEPKKKRRTALEIEQEKYPEYYALNEYQRKCLVANNYWNVLYGNKEIEVPPSDTYYHKYFDKGCYGRLKEYKKLKERIFEYDEKIKKNREEIEVKEVGQAKDEVKEIEVETTKIVADEKYVEQNGNPLVEDTVVEVKDVIEVESREEQIIEPVVEKPVVVENKKKKNNDEQTSLF